MGLFVDRGVQYRLVLASGRVVVFLSTKDTDARLVESEYYKSNCATWFSDAYKRAESALYIPEAPIDMTELEACELRARLSSFAKDEVVQHGWYDVVSMSSTLE